MKAWAILAALALGACTTAGVKEVETRDVVVTRTEKAIKPEQLPTPPAALSARPANASAALDVVVAKLCEYVGYVEKADPLLQTAAGVDLGDRVVEKVCRQ